MVDTTALAIGTFRTVDEGTTGSVDEFAVHAYPPTETQATAHYRKVRP